MARTKRMSQRLQNLRLFVDRLRGVDGTGGLRGWLAFKSCVTLTMLLALTTNGHCADEPPDAVYAVHVWGIYFNGGLAIVAGPIHHDSCQTTGRYLLETTENANPIPPDMKLQVSTCVPKAQLGQTLNGIFACHYRSSSPVPKHERTRIWLYSCTWRY